MPVLMSTTEAKGVRLMPPIDRLMPAFRVRAGELFHSWLSRCMGHAAWQLTTSVLLSMAIFSSIPAHSPAQVAVCSDVTLSLNQSLSYEGKKITATLRTDGRGTFADGSQATVLLSIHRETTGDVTENVRHLFVVAPGPGHSFDPALSVSEKWEITPLIGAEGTTPQRYELRGSITTVQPGLPVIVQQIAPAEFWVHPKPTVVDMQC